MNLIRASLLVLAGMGLATGCMEEAPAAKDCLRQFTEVECECLKQAIPAEKWSVLNLLAQDKGPGTRSRALALSLRKNSEGKCGPLEPRADSLPF
jgi:hypothetical protein